MKLGILGGGQLARMLALAAHPLGIQCRVLDPSADAPAADLAEAIRADYSDAAGLAKLIEGVDCLTYEFENVPASVFSLLPDSLATHPSPTALEAAQDRLQEKDLFNSLSIPTAEYAKVDSLAELETATTRFGFPCILKTCRLGYDGKGQRVLRSKADCADAFSQLGTQPLIVESFVRFDRELSIIGVRSVSGEIRCYSLTENLHREGILRRSIAPAPSVSPSLQELAESYFSLLANHLQYVGVLCIELFVEGDSLRANEFAPRVHNSGHWTIEGATTSQFENHVRAVLGLPLGSTESRGSSVMFNIIGTFPERQALLKYEGIHLHDYRKAPMLGRKLGHATFVSSSTEATKQRLAELEALFV